VIHADTPTGQCSCRGTLPSKITAPGGLYLWLPSIHAVEKVHGYLRDGDWSYQFNEGDRCVLVRLNGKGFGGLFDGLSGILTATERNDAQALFKPGSDELSVSDFPKVRSLKQIVALGQVGWLLDMLDEQRLTSLFQPIVWTEEPTKVYAYECLLRGIEIDGSLIPPAYILDVARDSGMIYPTDLAARTTAIRESVLRNVRSNLFINFTPTSVYEPACCLRSTIDAIDEADIPHENVVFEITETDKAHDVHRLGSIVEYYRRFGFGIALDDVGSGYSSLNLIHQLRPDFIKLDMHLIRGVDRDPYKATIAQKILEIAQNLGIRTVVEGIETAGEMGWVRAQGATFMQGYLIEKPSSLS
jgi:EAL domain-containing protein (putative c-di-GMP-specific phosphodiesterase class I)